MDGKVDCAVQAKKRQAVCANANKITTDNDTVVLKELGIGETVWGTVREIHTFVKLLGVPLPEIQRIPLVTPAQFTSGEHHDKYKYSNRN